MLQPVDNIYQIKAGDTLNNLAHRFYGDFRNWRELASLNNLDVFQDLTPGSTIRIPTKQEVDNIVQNINSIVQQAKNIDYSQLDLTVLKTSIASVNPHQLIDWLL